MSGKHSNLPLQEARCLLSWSLGHWVVRYFDSIEGQAWFSDDNGDLDILTWGFLQRATQSLFQSQRRGFPSVPSPKRDNNDFTLTLNMVLQRPLLSPPHYYHWHWTHRSNSRGRRYLGHVCYCRGHHQSHREPLQCFVRVDIDRVLMVLTWFRN